MMTKYPITDEKNCEISLKYRCFMGAKIRKKTETQSVSVFFRL